jgi:arsenate reductase (thioredoxin)
MDRKRVLFVCVHNSARSQMAEAFLKEMAGDLFEVESAGFEPAELNPLAIAAMEEAGHDISGNRADSVFERFRNGELFDYVIAVCDRASGQRCPTFPGITKRLDWNFDDPSAFEGTREERLEKTRGVRDRIRARLEEWVAEIRAENRP